MNIFGKNNQTSKKILQISGKKTRKKYKRPNCSPIVAGKTVSVDTCMTISILEKIKSEYNHTHRDNPIRTNKPKEILVELREHLSSCKEEDYWLNQIRDIKLRTKIEKYIFAPKHPKEWKYNPNEWLSNYDIFNVLTQWEDKYPNFEFIGPTSIDFDSPISKNGSCVDKLVCNLSILEQNRKKRDKIAIVFNLDKHDEPGSHWVSLWIDLKDRFIFYFDSAGSKIPPEIMKLVKRIKNEGKKMGLLFKFHENYPVIHQHGNTECGMYSIFFIITMLTGYSDGDFDKYQFKNVREKIRFFKQKRIPDKYVENLRWKYFND